MKKKALLMKKSFQYEVFEENLKLLINKNPYLYLSLRFFNGNNITKKKL